jgi:hypothetical protein
MVSRLLWRRLGALSGVVASVLLVAGSGISDINPLVSVSSSSSIIASVFVDQRTKILVGTYLNLLGVFFLIWFLSYLREFLLEATDERNWLASVAFGGGLVACAMLLLAAHFSQAFTVLPSYGTETQVSQGAVRP